MAPSLRLAFESNYIYLSAENMHLLHYTPGVGDPGADVTETAEVLFNTGHTTARAVIAAINSMIEVARRYQKLRVGSPVYIEYKPISTDDDYYRSEIRDGRLVLDEETTGERLSMKYAKGYLKAQVIWTRAPYWEGPLAQLQLADPFGVIDDSATVYNPAYVLHDTHISFQNLASVYNIHKTTGGLTIFVPGDIITITGTSLNDSNFTVSEIVSDTNIRVVELVHDEAAGAHVYIRTKRACNYVDISGDDLEGDIPAPINLKLLNTTAGADQVTEVYVSHNQSSYPAELEHILEAEDGSAIGGGPVITPTADAACSGGIYDACSWSVDTEVGLIAFTVSTLQLLYCHCNYFRLLMRLREDQAVEGMWYKVKITIGGSSVVLWESEYVLSAVDAIFVELCTLRLPLIHTTEGSMPLDIRLFAYHPAGGAVVQNVDFIQLSPMDGWRALFSNTAAVLIGFPVDCWLSDDMIKNELGTKGWGGDPLALSNFYTASAPFSLLPGVNHRFYFLHDIDSGAAPISRTLEIFAYYRPRRSAI